MKASTIEQIQQCLQDMKCTPLAEIFILVTDVEPFEALHIQPVIREVNGERKTFLALRNICIFEEFQKQGWLSRVAEAMENTKYPIIIDDIINKNVDLFFDKKGYQPFTYQFRGEDIHCRLLTDTTH